MRSRDCNTGTWGINQRRNSSLDKRPVVSWTRGRRVGLVHRRMISGHATRRHGASTPSQPVPWRAAAAFPNGNGPAGLLRRKRDLRSCRLLSDWNLTKDLYLLGISAVLYSSPLSRSLRFQSASVGFGDPGNHREYFRGKSVPMAQALAFRVHEVDSRLANIKGYI